MMYGRSREPDLTECRTRREVHVAVTYARVRPPVPPGAAEVHDREPVAQRADPVGRCLGRKRVRGIVGAAQPGATDLVDDLRHLATGLHESEGDGLEAQHDPQSLCGRNERLELSDERRPNVPERRRVERE